MNCEVNTDELLDRIGHDAELLQEVIELFYNEYPSHIEKIRSALAENNAEQVAKAAHTLKGSISNFACPSAFEAVYQLEQTAKNNTLDKTEDAIQTVDKKVQELRPVLEAILKDDLA
jgi:HPt (histidine-containing phosphotransfer) domain-containing protein